MSSTRSVSAVLAGILFSLLLSGQPAVAQDFNSYFDAISLLPNGKVYAFSGSQYARWSDADAMVLDAGYPKSIEGNWGDLPASFNNFADAITVLPDGKIYLFSGDQYVRYSDQNGTVVDPGYPQKLVHRVDAAATLPNGKIYLFFGDQYARYSDGGGVSDGADGLILDEGYPKPIKGYWGNLPDSFSQDIDAAAMLPNGKTYLFKNGEYVRYSDESGEVVDEGYPMPIQGNWGADLAEYDASRR